MQRKAQLSLLIIVGVLLLILVGLLVYSGAARKKADKGPEVSESIEAPAELKPAAMFVQECLEKEAMKTINKTAIQGGRPLAPRHAFVWSNMTLSHGYYYGINEIPSLEDMQNEMAGHLSVGLKECTNDLASFRDRGMDIDVGEISVKVMVGSDAVVIDLRYPMTVMKEEGRLQHDKFSAVIPSRLGYLHDAAWKIVDKDVKDIADLYYISFFDLGYYLTPIDPATETVFLSLKDGRGQNLDFNFINTYQENNAPVLELPSSFMMDLSETTGFYINATDSDGDSLVFSDNTELFDIDPRTGYVGFTAGKEGYYNIQINVTDGKEGLAEGSFAVRVG